MRPHFIAQLVRAASPSVVGSFFEIPIFGICSDLSLRTRVQATSHDPRVTRDGSSLRRKVSRRCLVGTSHAGRGECGTGAPRIDTACSPRSVAASTRCMRCRWCLVGWRAASAHPSSTVRTLSSSAHLTHILHGDVAAHTSSSEERRHMMTSSSLSPSKTADSPKSLASSPSPSTSSSSPSSVSSEDQDASAA